MRIVRYTYPSFRSLAPSWAAVPRSPWTGLESEIDRLFASALSGFPAQTATRFAVDLYEDKANTYVRAELPGLKREEINVEMSDGQLTIAAAHQAPASGAGQAEGKTEESFSFRRAISVPDEVQADKVSAAYDNGILTVTLPKRETVQPKKIAVAVK